MGGTLEINVEHVRRMCESEYAVWAGIAQRSSDEKLGWLFEKWIEAKVAHLVTKEGR